MQCIKCGMPLAVSGVHAGLTCFGCGSLFLEMRSLSIEPAKLNLDELVWRPADALCPSEGAELALVDLDGLAVEVCPKCGKVWLDKGEMERFKGKYGKKEDTPLWKRHQREQDDRRSVPWELFQWLLDFIY